MNILFSRFFILYRYIFFILYIQLNCIHTHTHTHTHRAESLCCIPETL